MKKTEIQKPYLHLQHLQHANLLDAHDEFRQAIHPLPFSGRLPWLMDWWDARINEIRAKAIHDIAAAIYNAEKIEVKNAEFCEQEARNQLSTLIEEIDRTAHDLLGDGEGYGLAQAIRVACHNAQKILQCIPQQQKITDEIVIKAVEIYLERLSELNISWPEGREDDNPCVDAMRRALRAVLDDDNREISFSDIHIVDFGINDESRGPEYSEGFRAGVRIGLTHSKTRVANNKA